MVSGNLVLRLQASDFPLSGVPASCPHHWKRPPRRHADDRTGRRPTSRQRGAPVESHLSPPCAAARAALRPKCAELAHVRPCPLQLPRPPFLVAQPRPALARRLLAQPSA